MNIGLDYVWMLNLRDTDVSQHLMTIYSLAIVSKAKVLLEIGAGQSTFALTAAANELGGEFYSIDVTPKLSSLRLFPEGEGILDKEPRYHPIEGSSLEVSMAFAHTQIDFFFLDSGHSYDLTLAELKRWTPLVKSGGWILLHDTGRLNTVFADCRRAMLDFLAETNWEVMTMDNQNRLSIIRKI